MCTYPDYSYQVGRSHIVQYCCGFCKLEYLWRYSATIACMVACDTVRSEYPHSPRNGTATCSRHSSTLWYETYLAGWGIWTWNPTWKHEQHQLPSPHSPSIANVANSKGHWRLDEILIIFTCTIQEISGVVCKKTMSEMHTFITSLCSIKCAHYSQVYAAQTGLR